LLGVVPPRLKKVFGFTKAKYMPPQQAA